MNKSKSNIKIKLKTKKGSKTLEEHYGGPRCFVYEGTMILPSYLFF
jgi:hypothetical protein